ncbi:hypothetical protein COBT_002778 [Conglomerata obtusa]
MMQSRLNFICTITIVLCNASDDSFESEDYNNEENSQILSITNDISETRNFNNVKINNNVVVLNCVDNFFNIINFKGNASNLQILPQSKINLPGIPLTQAKSTVIQNINQDAKVNEKQNLINKKKIGHDASVNARIDLQKIKIKQTSLGDSNSLMNDTLSEIQKLAKKMNDRMNADVDISNYISASKQHDNYKNQNTNSLNTGSNEQETVKNHFDLREIQKIIDMINNQLKKLPKTSEHSKPPQIPNLPKLPILPIIPIFPSILLLPSMPRK